jgi:threonine dehydratase
MPQRTPTFADIVQAAERIRPHAKRTPAMTSRTADERAGATLFFKAENFQRSGSFKFRGACNAVSALSAEEKKAGVLAFSSGNHAQAIALSGRLLGVSTTIVMPHDAPAMKMAATKGYGAEVLVYDRYLVNREEFGRNIAAERGLAVIPPFDHPDVVAGQGTATKELIEEVGPLDALFVCMGGGGLLSGALLAAAALSPGCAVYGVEPEAGNDGQQSFRSGAIVTIPVPKTLADGAQTTAMSDLTFGITKRLARDVFTASDEELVACMRFFAERMKMVVEPTGCLAAAAAFSGAAPIAGKRVGVIISGGNVDLATFATLISKT